MPSSSSFLRNAETFLHESRHKNLRHLNDEYGHGFQRMLVQLMKQVDMFISPTEVSNLVNASKAADGSPRSVFHDSTARRIERALDLPMTCLDLPDWQFRSSLDYFWQYAARADEDREWFDGLLKRLLDVPARPPLVKPDPSKPKSSIDWGAIRARLLSKQGSNPVE